MKNATIEVKRDGAMIAIAVKGAGIVTLNMDKISPENMAYAAFHGLKQRVVDAAALARDTKTGQAAPADEKLEAIQAVVEHLESGTAQWSRVVAGQPKGGLLFEALCRVYGHQKAPSDIRAWLDTRSDKEQMALREDEAIAPVIATIKAERVKADTGPKADTKALLADLTK